MIQKKEELDNWHSIDDPWGYNNSEDDIARKEILLSEIPDRKYFNVLDIGCGQGFITVDLPGENIFGVDISQSAIDFASKLGKNKNIRFHQGSIFEIDELFDIKFDLIIITGVLYPQYIGKSSSLLYLLIDRILMEGGVLMSVHINDWYSSQFPYLKVKQFFYNYRQFTHNLEIYIK